MNEQYPTVISDGIEISSNEGTQEELEASLEAPEPEPKGVADKLVDAVIEDRTGKPAEEKKARNRRDDPQEAVKSAVAKQREAERERDSIKAELEAARKDNQQPKPRPEPPPPTPPRSEPARPAPSPAEDPEPDPAAFAEGQFDRGYLKAQARWEARQEFREQQRATEQFAVQQRALALDQEQVQQFTTKLQTAQAEDPQFAAHVKAAVLREGPSPVDVRLLETPRLSALKPGERATFGNFLVEQVFHSEHPKDLILYLSNVAEVQRLSQLPPDQVIREIARFEASLSRPAAATPAPAPAPPRSQARPPIRPVGGSAQVANDEPPGDDASEAEHEAYYGPRRVKYR